VLGLLSSLMLVSGLALAGTPTVLVGMIGGAVLGGSTGIVQWLVLRRHIREAAWWILASIVGGLVGLALGLVLSDEVQPLMAAFLGEAVQSRPTGPRLLLSSALATGTAGAVAGIGLGSAQWLALRRHVRSAGWWIVASGLGWMISLSVSAAIVDEVGILISLLVAGLASGAATGSLLAYLLAIPARPDSARSDPQAAGGTQVG
jgi:hypothetical protein